jgi:hypothetical protein
MSAIIYLVCFLFLVLLLQSCKDYSEEALAEGKRFFDERLLQCGDSAYAEIGNSIILEFKNITYFVSGDELTKDDKKNGIDWKGSVGVRGTQYRHYEYFPKWSPWQNWIPSNVIHTGIGQFSLWRFTQAFVQRKNGNWRTDLNTTASLLPTGNAMRTARSCEQIPQS